jgi:hypothetical protein
MSGKYATVPGGPVYVGRGQDFIEGVFGENHKRNAAGDANIRRAIAVGVAYALWKKSRRRGR